MTTTSATPQRAALGYTTLLRSYLAPRWRQVGALASLLAASIGLQLGSPLLLRAFIDAATSRAANGELVRLAALYLAVAAALQVVAVAETWTAENLGQATTNDLRADLARHCLGLDLGFHHARTPGELIERVDGDVASLAAFFSRFVVQIVGNALLLVAVLALLFGVSLTIGLAVTAFALVALAALFRLRNAAVPRWTKSRQASAELFGFLEERLAGTEDLRPSGAVDHTLRRLAERSHSLFRADVRRALVATATGFSAGPFLWGMTAIGLGLGAAAYLRGEISIGSVYLVFSYTQLLSRPIEQLTRQMQELQRAAASLGRIREMFAVQSQLDDRGKETLPSGALGVEVDDVSFGYGSEEPVLRALSLAMRPGEIVGVLGRTGSGKTTLARLVARFFDPEVGAIRIGEVDLRQVSPEELRRRVGVVTQDVHLFAASVRDNLTMFDRSLSDARIAEVLRQLGMWDWCRSLPGGLDAVLAPGGGLSAGESQLIAFARVFLRDPGLIILDEASSRLDPSTEHRIESALDRLLAGRTAIVIAHRLATVGRADTIVILEDGEVCERGQREALARDPASRFSRLRQVGLEEVLA